MNPQPVDTKCFEQRGLDRPRRLGESRRPSRDVLGVDETIAIGQVEESTGDSEGVDGGHALPGSRGVLGTVEDVGLWVHDDRRGDTVVLVVVGELDLAGAPTVRQHLALAQESLPARLVVDVSGVGHLDSAGVGVLVDAHRRALAHGTAFVVAGADAGVTEALALSGADGVLTLSASVDEALDV
jgi:anti-sigma B factor antagonist